MAASITNASGLQNLLPKGCVSPTPDGLHNLLVRKDLYAERCSCWGALSPKDLKGSWHSRKLISTLGPKGAARYGWFVMILATSSRIIITLSRS